MDSRILNVGKNKGLSRVFLDKQILLKNGIQFGMNYDYFLVGNSIIIRFTESGLKRVSGKIGRPVIDISNRKLDCYFGNCKTYKLSFLKSGNTIDKDNASKYRIEKIA